MHTTHSSSHLLGGSASVHAGIPHGCGPGDPLGVGLETPPGQTPQLPPWVWAWRPPQARPLNFAPLWVWAWIHARHAGIPPAMHAGIPALSPPPVPGGQNSWHTLLKILPCPKHQLAQKIKSNKGKRGSVFRLLIHLTRLPVRSITCTSPVVCRVGGNSCCVTELHGISYFTFN